MMSASGMIPSSRPPLARMMRIHEILRVGRPTNSTRLAQELEVSTKTIMRDLAFMRDQQRLPLEYDPRTFSWRYTEPVRDFPTLKVSEGELLALLIAQKALTLYAGTPYHALLERAFTKLSAGLSDKITFSTSGSLNNISFHHAGLGRTDLKAFEKLAQAIDSSCEIEFGYRKPGQKKTENRRVQPYHLANRENSWYLVGYDQERQALRNFAVVRMSQIKTINRHFARSVDFSPEKHFGKAFGAFVGTGDYRVEIHFSPAVADQVKERFWHESQEIRELPNGYINATFNLGGLDEVLRWILGWGEHAEVRAPSELRDRVRVQAQALVKNHPKRP